MPLSGFAKPCHPTPQTREIFFCCCCRDNDLTNHVNLFKVRQTRVELAKIDQLVNCSRIRDPGLPAAPRSDRFFSVLSRLERQTLGDRRRGLTGQEAVR